MGQSKKRRPCPAVQREISSAECGENRLSRYACPESCPFNPFNRANYTALLGIEGDLDVRAIDRASAESARMSADVAEARRSNPAHGWHAAIVDHLFYRRDQAGKTFGQRWSDAGFAGLNNDQRVFFRGKMQMRVVLLEVQRILDAQTLEAVDLLNPAAGRLTIVDRSLASRMVRFSTLLTWGYPLPHFSRMSGTALTMADLGPFSAREMLDACIAHLGGPAGGEELQRWLVANFTRIDDALVATGLERRRQMFSSMDAAFGVVAYALEATFADCRRALVGDPAVEVDELNEDERAQGLVEAMVWCETEPARVGSVSLVAGHRVLGRVLLGRKEWRLEATGGAKTNLLRERFEARLGARVRFVRERRDDLAGQMAAREPAANLALVPPKLLELPPQWDMSSSRIPALPPGVSLEQYEAETLRAYRQRWLDEPLPLLGGQTPRSAASMPEWRARILETVKAQVRLLDQKNLDTGRSDDINGLVRELGLHEIDFPPPPLRPRPAPAERREDLDGEFDDDGAGLPPLVRRGKAGWSAPPLGPAPLTGREAAERIENAMASFDTAADAMAEVVASGSTLLDDVEELADGLMDDRDIAFLSGVALPAWFGLVPRGRAAPKLRFDVMKWTVDGDLKTLETAGSDRLGQLKEMMTDSPQPYFLAAITAVVLDARNAGPEAAQPNPESIVAMLIVLKALVAEIDHAVRRA